MGCDWTTTTCIRGNNHSSSLLCFRLDGMWMNKGNEEEKRSPAFNRTLVLLQQVLKSSSLQYRGRKNRTSKLLQV